MKWLWQWLMGLVYALADCSREREQTERLGRYRAEWMVKNARR